MATALIVDDDAEFQACIATMLRPQYDVVVAASGAEALKRAASHHPALMFLDVRLPDIDGIDLAQEFRTTAMFESVPIVLFTGHVDSHVTEAARWMRHTSLLKKPCDRAAFEKAVELALGDSLHGGTRCSTRDAANGRSSRHVDEETGFRESPIVRHRCTYDPEHFPIAVSAPSIEATKPTGASLCALISDVCHDARSSLFVLSEFASQTADGLDGQEHAERRKMLQVIQDRTTELRVMFDLLHTARTIQEERIPRRHEAVSLCELIEEVVIDCKQLVHRKLCTCEVSFGSCDVRIWSDVDSFKAALLGLFSHMLSVARSSSTVQLRASSVTDSAAPMAQIVLRAQLVGGGMHAGARSGDRGAALGNECEAAKCELAATIIRQHGGTLSFDQQQQQLTATISLPLPVDAASHPVFDRQCHVSTYPRD